MRLCRFLHEEQTLAGFYGETHVFSLTKAARLFSTLRQQPLDIPLTDDLIGLLDPDKGFRGMLRELDDWCRSQSADVLEPIRLRTEQVQLLLPVPKPPKLFLLAGNYVDHIKEDGSRHEERHDTFPYVFMKPPSTTLADPHVKLELPKISPHFIDWEVELAAVIGRKSRGIDESRALEAVAGYTILNDISDRKFRPNPDRKPRDWDRFFDWMHGKWHDGFAPCGPCIATTDTITDPQLLQLQLTLNGELRQNGFTRDQVFPLAAVIAFISGFVTLEPGDIISTGTPAGVGSVSNTYLKPGDILVATIPSIGSLTTKIEGIAT